MLISQPSEMIMVTGSIPVKQFQDYHSLMCNINAGLQPITTREYFFFIAGGYLFIFLKKEKLKKFN